MTGWWRSPHSYLSSFYARTIPIPEIFVECSFFISLVIISLISKIPAKVTLQMMTNEANLLNQMQRVLPLLPCVEKLPSPGT